MGFFGNFVRGMAGGNKAAKAKSFLQAHFVVSPDEDMFQDMCFGHGRTGGMANSFFNPEELAIFFLGTYWIYELSPTVAGREYAEIARRQIDLLYKAGVAKSPIAREEFDKNFDKLFGAEIAKNERERDLTSSEFTEPDEVLPKNPEPERFVRSEQSTPKEAKTRTDPAPPPVTRIKERSDRAVHGRVEVGDIEIPVGPVGQVISQMEKTTVELVEVVQRYQPPPSRAVKPPIPNAPGDGEATIDAGQWTYSKSSKLLSNATTGEKLTTSNGLGYSVSDQFFILYNRKFSRKLRRSEVRQVD